MIVKFRDESDFHLQGTDFHPKYTGENLTCTVQGLKRSTQYKFRVSGGVNVHEGAFLCRCFRDSSSFFLKSFYFRPFQ